MADSYHLPHDAPYDLPHDTPYDLPYDTPYDLPHDLRFDLPCGFARPQVGGPQGRPDDVTDLRAMMAEGALVATPTGVRGAAQLGPTRLGRSHALAAGDQGDALLSSRDFPVDFREDLQRRCSGSARICEDRRGISAGGSAAGYKRRRPDAMPCHVLCDL